MSKAKKAKKVVKPVPYTVNFKARWQAGQDFSLKFTGIETPTEVSDAMYAAVDKASGYKTNSYDLLDPAADSDPLGAFNVGKYKTQNAEFVVVPNKASKVHQDHIRLLLHKLHDFKKPEELDDNPDRLRLASWNLQHFNNSFTDECLDAMGLILNDLDIVFCVEVTAESSKSAPDWKKLLSKTTQTFNMHEVEMSKGSCGVVLWVSPKVSVNHSHVVLWQKHFKRFPFTSVATIKKWPFACTTVHLPPDSVKSKSGIETGQVTLDEVAKLPYLRAEIQKQVSAPIDCIIVGDFNCDVRDPTSKTYFDKIVDGKGKSYVALINEKTMNMKKNPRCNDNILIAPDLLPFLFGNPIVRTYNENDLKELGDLVISSKHTHWSNMQAFFTDHSIVIATFEGKAIGKKASVKPKTNQLVGD